MKRSPLFLALLGFCLAVGAIGTVALLDRPLANRQPVAFVASTGDPLVGAYFPGTEALGVILLEGFGSDQVTMTSLASEFARAGWHVFTFDFSGHGRSPGALTFDNAQTDRLAYQALSGLQEFKQRSGLRADQIFLMGHSLGARVALQAATITPERLAGLALLGTQVNLSTNLQSEFFTGVTDTDLPWVRALGPENPPVPVLLVSGAWDDILTPENAELLFQRLGGDEAGSNRRLVILPAIVHNYEPFSFRVLSEIAKWENRLDQPPIPAAVRIVCWILGLMGIFLMVTGGNRWLTVSESKTKEPAGIQIQASHPATRVIELNWYGFPALALESAQLRVVAVPVLGGRIVSLFDLVHQQEWLLQPDRPPDRLPEYGEAFSKYGLFGWDEIIPSIHPCDYPYPGQFFGLPIPDHGEVWALPWQVSFRNHSRISMQVQGKVFPYLLKRSLLWGESERSFCLSYQLTNIGAEPVFFLWCAHPQFIAQPQDRVILPDQVKRVVNARMDADWGEIGAQHSWPVAHLLNGKQMHLDQVEAASRRSCRKFYVHPDEMIERAGLYRLSASGILWLHWSCLQLPYFAIWTDQACYSHQFVVALEPASAYMDSLSDAYQRGKGKMLLPGQTETWELFVSISETGDWIF